MPADSLSGKERPTRPDGSSAGEPYGSTPSELRGSTLGEKIVAHDLLERILETAEDAIVSIDADHRIVMFNRGAEKTFGFSRDEVLGERLDLLLPERYRNSHSDWIEAFAKSAEESRVMARRGRIRGLRKDGVEFPAEASISQVDQNGGKIFTVILRDTTERQAAESKLRAALEEKEILLREVHHRVKNNLQVVSSLLNLQARAADSDYLRRAFEESQGRVQTMALIHEQLYRSKDFSQVHFREYVSQLTSRLFHTYGVEPGRVRLETEIRDVGLGVDLAIPCGLIINELVSNSLKYAFPDEHPGVIRIEVEGQPDGSVVLLAADDGVGLPDEVGFWSTKTLGLRLVRSLVRQIDGEVELGGPPGVEFRIRFSPEAAREAPKG